MEDTQSALYKGKVTCKIDQKRTQTMTMQLSSTRANQTSVRTRSVTRSHHAGAGGDHRVPGRVTARRGHGDRLQGRNKRQGMSLRLQG